MGFSRIGLMPLQFGMITHNGASAASPARLGLARLPSPNPTAVLRPPYVMPQFQPSRAGQRFALNPRQGLRPALSNLPLPSGNSLPKLTQNHRPTQPSLPCSTGPSKALPVLPSWRRASWHRPDQNPTGRTELILHQCPPLRTEECDGGGGGVGQRKPSCSAPRQPTGLERRPAPSLTPWWVGCRVGWRSPYPYR